MRSTAQGCPTPVLPSFCSPLCSAPRSPVTSKLAPVTPHFGLWWDAAFSWLCPPLRRCGDCRRSTPRLRSVVAAASSQPCPSFRRREFAAGQHLVSVPSWPRPPFSSGRQFGDAEIPAGQHLRSAPLRARPLLGFALRFRGAESFLSGPVRVERAGVGPGGLLEGGGGWVLVVQEVDQGEQPDGGGGAHGGVEFCRGREAASEDGRGEQVL